MKSIDEQVEETMRQLTARLTPEEMGALHRMARGMHNLRYPEDPTEGEAPEDADLED